MKRLLIDLSSTLRACHHLTGDPNGYPAPNPETGELETVNTAEWAYEGWIGAYLRTLELTGTTPHQTVIVKDGMNSRSFRGALFPGYKAKRKPRAKAWYDEYNKASDGVCDEILSMGGSVVVQNGMEADDVIAYLCQNLEDTKAVWCRDKDMLALQAPDVDILYIDQLNPEIAKNVPSEKILLYKALVGDTSDCLPGAKGFGPKAFLGLALTFGYDVFAEIEELIQKKELYRLAEDVDNYKPLQKLIDYQQDVYISYACAKFYPEEINTARQPLDIQTGMVQEWTKKNHPLLQQYFADSQLVERRRYDLVFRS